MDAARHRRPPKPGRPWQSRPGHDVEDGRKAGIVSGIVRRRKAVIRARKARRMRGQGIPIPEIAARLGVSVRSIWSYLAGTWLRTIVRNKTRLQRTVTVSRKGVPFREGLGRWYGELRLLRQIESAGTVPEVVVSEMIASTYREIRRLRKRFPGTGKAWECLVSAVVADVKRRELPHGTD